MADISKIILPNKSSYDVKDASARAMPSAYYGTCATAAATAAKVVTVSSDQNFVLKAGAVIGVKFTYTNTASSCTINVNSTGAKSIWYNTAAYTGTDSGVCGYANRTIYYMYNGTYWVHLSYGYNTNGNTVPTAYSTTAAGTAAKTATCTNYKLLAKSYTILLITTTNTAASALTLNINGQGAKPIYINGSASSSSNHTMPAGSYLVYYDGTNYYIRTDGKITGDITGNAATVNGKTVGVNVPADAKFTDTVVTKTSELTNDSNFAVDANYVHTDNNYTSTEKTKLAGISTGAEVNVQSDWNVTDTSSDAYIKNKPTIPTDTDTWKAYYGTCATAGGTAAKVVTVSEDQKFSLKVGTVIGVKFSVTNTADSVTLNVNSTGAKSIWYNTAVYTGSGNGVAGYANRTYYYMYNGTNWLMLSNGLINENTYDRTYLSNSGYKAKSAITAGNIIVAGSDGLYFHLKSGAAFDITQPILYASSACNAGATNNSGYIIIPFSVTTTQSITLTAYKPVYIKGHLEGTTFTPSGTSPLTQTEPTTADGYKYLLLGRACNSTTVMYLLPEHPIFERTSDAAWGTFHPMHVPLSNSFTYTGVGEAALDAVAGKTLFEYFKQLVRVIAVEKTDVTCNPGAGYVDIPFTVTMLTPTFTTLATYVNSTPNIQWIYAQPQVFYGDGTNPYIRMNYYNHYSSAITGTFRILVLYSNYEGIYN